jgi:polyisoprenoid-binding protein YceI
MMNRMLVGIIGLATAGAVQAEIFTVDTGHSGIGFSVKHMMVSNTKGSFNTFEGTIDYDSAAKTLKSVEGSIDAASIDTNNEARDKHLRNEDFFNVSKFPKMTFKSTSVEKTGDQTFSVTGKLNVLGVDRDVTLPVTINGPVDDPWGNKRIGIEANGTLNRRDLGITESPAAMIADEVEVDIAAEATHKE